MVIPVVHFFAVFVACFLPFVTTIANAADLAEPLDFEVRLQTIIEQDDGDFLWFHPRPVVIPASRHRPESAIVTIQKHLFVSDFYSGLFQLGSSDRGTTWTGPDELPSLGWQREPSGTILAVADVTPGWHEPSGRVLAVGAHVRYSEQGAQLDDIRRAHQTAYATYDPERDKWSAWQMLEMPDDPKYDFARSACGQWEVSDRGTVLLPFYSGKNSREPWVTSIVECDFDGSELRFLRQGNELALPVARGLYEPSLIRHDGKYLMTIRNDERGYVSVSEDGLNLSPITRWRFDDGTELGSYNTQQHWLSHSDGLFLCYTRRGADNDHITRHRAPLFIAQVDPHRLVVVKQTEKILVPERGATLGNFGAAAISRTESWVTVSEGLFSEASRTQGASGATFLARIVWSAPNQQFPE